MTGSESQRRELGAFLRRSRDALDRSELGLPPGGRGRTRGLRREEVAVFSSVSVTWYTWLEQGRDITPSRQVLEAVSAALRLDDGQRAYVLGLGGYASASAPGTDLRPMPGHLRALVDALGDSPAFVLTADWHIAAWNAAYEALFPRVAQVAESDRNLLGLIFTDPSVRELLDDWESDSRHFLAEFRAEVGGRLADPRIAPLVERLREASADFARAWKDHGVERFASRERWFVHPRGGRVRYLHHRLVAADEPSFHLVVYTPQGGDAAGGS